ncbi:hypothetical protein Pint_05061 [Pistacia integerrima]|uniref:Uncharacterized protein n=1 Tax=Pistacia integerrima TaxID=434235 RepID=A0ACC0Z752_9ROSI|nr:hypothetical protein Pint_05061 [Pistacia integerrima]
MEERNEAIRVPKDGSEPHEHDSEIQGIHVEMDDMGRPVIIIPEEKSLKMSLPWAYSLIIKLMGRSMGYMMLKQKIVQLWANYGEITLIDLEKDNVKKIEHEGVHLICFGRGKYDHNATHCPSYTKEALSQETPRTSDTVNGTTSRAEMLQAKDKMQQSIDLAASVIKSRFAGLEDEDNMEQDDGEESYVGVAGGDGTAGLLLGVVCDLKLSHSPPVATVPLGTGNNLPFAFGWTSGGWGRIDTDNAVDSMLHYANVGLTTFDMADICKVFASHACVCVVIKQIGKQWDVSMDDGPAKDLYGIFINRIHREGPPELLDILPILWLLVLLLMQEKRSFMGQVDAKEEKSYGISESAPNFKSKHVSKKASKVVRRTCNKILSNEANPAVEMAQRDPGKKNAKKGPLSCPNEPISRESLDRKRSSPDGGNWTLCLAPAQSSYSWNPTPVAQAS